MRKFPGKVEMVKSGWTHKLVLNDEQVRWLRRWFPVTENKILCKAMGVSDFTLHRWAKDYSLEKSEKGLKEIQRRRSLKAAQTNEMNGCYDRKRGRPVSEATREGVRRRWEEERAGLREDVHSRIKREDPERYKMWMRKRSEERKESIRKEKMRILYDLPRKTNIKVAVLYPYRRSQVAHRYNAVQRGYVLAEDCSEGSPDRYVIFYDNKTHRSKEFERNLVKDGFRIERW